ncbi:reverse transcriptase domain-containing protein [Streptomyces sp. NPDC054794]
MRVLGIPAVADRVAQTAVARHLMRRVDPVFHPDSFGYRPGRSALDAVAKCRERCWKRNWVIELDISQFFDGVPWDLLVKAVEAHTDADWVKLYVQRWLAAPLVMPDGGLRRRQAGAARLVRCSPCSRPCSRLYEAFPGGLTPLPQEWPAVPRSGCASRRWLRGLR